MSSLWGLSDCITLLVQPIPAWFSLISYWPHSAITQKANTDITTGRISNLKQDNLLLVTAEAYEGKMMATLENQMLKEKENKFIDDEHIHKVKNEMQMNSKAPNLEA